MSTCMLTRFYSGAVLAAGSAGAIWAEAETHHDVLLLPRQSKTAIRVALQSHPQDPGNIPQVCSQAAEKKFWEE